jgi:3-deoxy-D-manno-octulosonic-acid transferase
MRLALILLIYTLIGLALLPLAIVIALFSHRGRAFFEERIGIWEKVDSPFILIHGASLGEIQGVTPLAKEIKAKYPNYQVVLSSTSNTGRQAAEKSGFISRILPFDLYFLYSLAFLDNKPKAVILTETEIWPALIGWLRFNRVPWVVVNGRISEKSWSEYRILAPILRPFLKQTAAVCTSDEASVDRFIKLGVNPNVIIKTGNTKYDTPLPTLNAAEIDSLKAELVGGCEKVIILGSIRPGEDKIWNPVIRKVLDYYEKVGFVVAPRHPEKFEYFADSLNESGIEFARRKENRPGRVLLLDSLGELSKVFALGDIAFIGGTLEDFGGHNPLEAMGQECAIIMGPSVFVISEIVDALKDADALVTISNSEECDGVVRELLSNPQRVKELGQRARNIAAQFQGATTRAIKVFSPILGEPKR